MVSKPPSPSDDSAAPELIEYDDFQSVELAISVRNMTSGSNISDGSVKMPRVELIEFQNHGLTLELPRASCAQGHSLMVDINVVQPASKRMSFSATTKVEHVERQTDKTKKAGERVELSLIQFEEESWDRLQKLFTSRQSEIEDFFKAARGY